MPQRDKSLLENYRATLTSFGFSRIKSGRPFEKVFWTVGVMIIILFTCHTLYRNSVRYFAYGVRTEVHNLEIPERKLPVIILCLSSTVLNSFLCYNNASYHSYQECKMTGSTGTYIKYGHWLTGEQIQGKDVGNDCHVFNEHGNISISTGTEYQILDFYSEPTNSTLYVSLLSHEEFRSRKELVYTTDFNKMMTLEKGLYDFYITEKHTHRLPSPYMTGCVDSEVVSNQFSDRYTHESCQELCAYNYMLKECHDVIDIWKKYHAEDPKPFNSTKFTSRKKCMETVVDQMVHRASSICHCKRECEEITYSAQEKLKSKSNDLSRAAWRLYLSNIDPVTEIKMVPDFPLEQFLGTFGGVIGLGGKFQVVFKLSVFLFLVIGKLFARNNIRIPN